MRNIFHTDLTNHQKYYLDSSYRRILEKYFTVETFGFKSSS